MAGARRSTAMLCSLAFLLLAASARAQLSASDIHSAVLGKRQVVDVMCPTCTSHTRDEVGSVIELGDSRITNAYGGDCTNLPGYSLLRKTAVQKLLAAKGKSWQRELKQALKSEKIVLYGYITCGGGNHMRVIFTPNGPAYYFWEGDTVFVLKRTSS